MPYCVLRVKEDEACGRRGLHGVFGPVTECGLQRQGANLATLTLTCTKYPVAEPLMLLSLSRATAFTSGSIDCFSQTYHLWGHRLHDRPEQPGK
jgi:hypothetical protein